METVLCDIPLARLLDFHDSHAGLVTITAVLMHSQYGVLSVGRVRQGLRNVGKKPLIKDHWINAGFMVLEKEVFDHWQGESLERHVLPHLVSKGAVYSYRHNGFLQIRRQLQRCNGVRGIARKQQDTLDSKAIIRGILARSQGTGHRLYRFLGIVAH